MAAPSREMVSALVDYEFATLRIEAVRQRVVREGLTRESSLAFVEAQAEQTMALCEIDRARRGERVAEMRAVVDEACEASS